MPATGWCGWRAETPRSRAAVGGACASPRALGPLYSGYYGATALRGLGLADGPEADLALADRLFAAPTPTLREMY